MSSEEKLTGLCDYCFKEDFCDYNPQTCCIKKFPTSELKKNFIDYHTFLNGQLIKNARGIDNKIHA